MLLHSSPSSCHLKVYVRHSLASLFGLVEGIWATLCFVVLSLASNEHNPPSTKADNDLTTDLASTLHPSIVAMAAIIAEAL